MIFVLDHGRIVEQGKHAELLARGGRYASLYRQQFEPGRARPAPERAPDEEALDGGAGLAALVGPPSVRMPADAWLPGDPLPEPEQLADR